MWHFFSWETKEFGNFSQKSSAVFFWNFWQQKQNLTENYQHNCQNSTPRFRRDFWGNTCSSEKKSTEYSDFQGNFSFFCRFLGWLSKRRPWPKWEYWGKTIFFGKKMFLIFFRLLSGELSYFGDESPTDCQKSVGSVSRKFFQGDRFFSERFFNSLTFSLRNWAQPFKELEKNGFLTGKNQHPCHSWIPRFQRTLCGFFSGKTFSCKNVFATGAEFC